VVWLALSCAASLLLFRAVLTGPYVKQAQAALSTTGCTRLLCAARSAYCMLRVSWWKRCCMLGTPAGSTCWRSTMGCSACWLTWRVLT
jgi:hypothetical protein